MVKSRVEKVFFFLFFFVLILLVDDSCSFLISGLSVVNYVSKQVVHLLM